MTLISSLVWLGIFLGIPYLLKKKSNFYEKTIEQHDYYALLDAENLKKLKYSLKMRRWIREFYELDYYNL